MPALHKVNILFNYYVILKGSKPHRLNYLKKFKAAAFRHLVNEANEIVI